MHKNRSKKHHPTKSDQQEDKNGWHCKVQHKKLH
jgi:hypothetical protein